MLRPRALQGRQVEPVVRLSGWIPGPRPELTEELRSVVAVRVAEQLLWLATVGWLGQENGQRLLGSNTSCFLNRP